MYDAAVAFTAIMILGVIIFFTVADGLSFDFTFVKWFFGFFFIAGLIVGMCTYVGLIQF